MSFKELSAEDLAFVAEVDLDLDLPEDATRKQVEAAILEANISWADAVEKSETCAALQEQKDEEAAAQARAEANAAAVVTTKVTKAEKPEKAPREESNERLVLTSKDVVATTVRPAKTLIRMDRANPSFQIRGYTFTQQNPFALVTEADAEYLVELDEGFYYATPKEAAEFYG